MIDSSSGDFVVDFSQPIRLDMRDTNPYFAHQVEQRMLADGMTEEEAAACVINGLCRAVEPRVDG